MHGVASTAADSKWCKPFLSRDHVGESLLFFIVQVLLLPFAVLLGVCCLHLRR